MNGFLLYLLNWLLGASLRLYGDGLLEHLYQWISGKESSGPHSARPMPKNHKYPHLLPDDVKVWEQFLLDLPDLFQVLDYDVRVGDGRPMPDLPTPKLRRMATDLSQRRIDVVGHQDNTRTIIEVTHTAGLKAIGQMTAYPTLYRAKYPGSYRIKSLLVAGALESDIVVCLDKHQIPYWTPKRGLSGF